MELSNAALISSLADRYGESLIPEQLDRLRRREWVEKRAELSEARYSSERG